MDILVIIAGFFLIIVLIMGLFNFLAWAHGYGFTGIVLFIVGWVLLSPIMLAISYFFGFIAVYKYLKEKFFG